jgi:hypothetical protein
MTKKDYELLADSIRKGYEKSLLKEAEKRENGTLGENESLEPFQALCYIVNEITNALEQDNPRFRRATFSDRALLGH